MAALALTVVIAQEPSELVAASMTAGSDDRLFTLMALRTAAGQSITKADADAAATNESRTGTYCCLSDWPRCLGRLVTMATSNRCLSTDCGTIDVIEVPSKTQTRESQEQKVEKMKGILGDRAGERSRVEPIDDED